MADDQSENAKETANDNKFLIISTAVAVVIFILTYSVFLFLSTPVDAEAEDQMSGAEMEKTSLTLKVPVRL